MLTVIFAASKLSPGAQNASPRGKLSIKITIFLGTNHSFVLVAAQPEHVSAGGLEVEKEQEEFLGIPGNLPDFLPEDPKISPVKFSIGVVQVVSRRESIKIPCNSHFLILIIFSSRLINR